MLVEKMKKKKGWRRHRQREDLLESPKNNLSRAIICPSSLLMIAHPQVIEPIR